MNSSSFGGHPTSVEPLNSTMPMAPASSLSTRYDGLQTTRENLCFSSTKGDGEREREISNN